MGCACRHAGGILCRTPYLSKNNDGHQAAVQYSGLFGERCSGCTLRPRRNHEASHVHCQRARRNGAAGQPPYHSRSSSLTITQLKKFPFLHAFPSSANFVLFRVTAYAAQDVALALRSRGILVCPHLYRCLAKLRFNFVKVRFFGQQGGNLGDFIRISAARQSDTAGFSNRHASGFLY
jgi:hypothetical protein